MQDKSLETSVTSERPSWDEYFMELAFAASRRSTCPRRSVGAILVKDKTVIGTGYNGSPSSAPHCTDVGCLIGELGTCTRTQHAEENALSRALVVPHESTIYCTDLPCIDCARRIVKAGVKRVVYSKDYSRTRVQVLSLFGENRIVLCEIGG